MEVQNILLTQIEPSPLNPRKTISQTEIEELAQSIEHQGLLQPITVRPVELSGVAAQYLDKKLGVKYEIIYGERRYRAFLLLRSRNGKTVTIPSIVTEMNDDAAYDAMITENLQRRDVDPIEEAFAFGELIKRGSTAEEVAARFGKTVRFVQDRVKLNCLIPELLEKVKSGKMAIAAGMTIAKFDEKTQRQFLDAWGSQVQIGKNIADRFCSDIFMRLGRASWYEDDKEFAGGCWKPCSQCEHNTANAGCLFWEMKGDDDSAKCTKRSGYIAKHTAYLIDYITKRDDILRAGEELALGKTVLIDTANIYNEPARKVHDDVVAELRKHGYEMTDETIFSGLCPYRHGDERADELVRKGEAFRCLDVFSYGTIPVVKYAYYYPKKEADGETEKTVSGSPEAIRLVAQRKRNLELVEGQRAKILAKKCAGTESPLDRRALLESEQRALDILLIRLVAERVRKSDELKKRYGIEGRDSKFGTLPFGLANEIAEKFPEDRPIWTRMYLLDKFSKVNYPCAESALCELVMKEWDAHEIEVLDSWCEDQRVTKTRKIDARLKELGYDTAGNKLPEKPVGSKVPDTYQSFLEMKRRKPDALLLFRVGDFYEAFDQDAKDAADILGITLTRRPLAAGGKMTYTGFPHHALDEYLPKLVRAGKRVAICEQDETKGAKK